MKITIWDNHNKQWLEPMAIFFDKNNNIWKVDACKIGDEPLVDGWYSLKDKDLEKIAIIGEINFNNHLIPKEDEV